MSQTEPATWDYRVETTIDAARLAELGRDGWELTGAAPANDGGFVFKRPGLTFRERVTLDQKARYYAAWGKTPAGKGQER